MNTMLLSVDRWDLLLDASRNIALAQAPYALAQDVASAIRTFLGEVYFDTTLGVPYRAQILGQMPPVSLVQARMIEAALTVPGVVEARCIIESVIGRQLKGQVIFTDSTGKSAGVAL